VRDAQPRFLVVRVRALRDTARHGLGHDLVEVVDAFAERPCADRLRDDLEAAQPRHQRHPHAFAVLEVPDALGS